MASKFQKEPNRNLKYQLLKFFFKIQWVGKTENQLEPKNEVVKRKNKYLKITKHTAPKYQEMYNAKERIRYIEKDEKV